MKWMRRIFIIIGVLTLIHQYIWFQRVPKTPTNLIAPQNLTVWADGGGQALTHLPLIASIGELKDGFGADQFHLNLVFRDGIWFVDSARLTPLDSVVKRFPFLNYWMEFTQNDTTGLDQIVQLIHAQELERQVILSSEHKMILDRLRRALPRIPQIMPEAELNRFIWHRKLLLLPFFHTDYDVALVPMDTTRYRKELSRRFVRLMDHLGIPVWVDHPENLSQIIWLEERHVRSVRMTRVDLALMPRATLLNQSP